MFNTLIIGGGISGLFVLKHLKEQNPELDVLVIEKNAEPFGVWNIANKPSVLDFTYTITSKLYMSISDFPIPDDYPEFMHHSLILKYYKQYAEHFDLLKHVKCNVNVISAYKKNDLWVIKTNDKIYTCVNLVIASGTVNQGVNIPTDAMYKNFTGLSFHADEFYKHNTDLVDKNIIIVGVSDTGCDLAEYLCKSNRISLSSNRGVWFQGRNTGGLTPTELIWSYFFNTFKGLIGNTVFNMYFNSVFFNIHTGFDGHGIEVWRSQHNLLKTYAVKSKEVITSIAKGQITPVNGIVDIDKKTIKFKNGHIDTYDVIIFATGYKPFGGLTFFEDEKYYKKLYKNIFSQEDKNLFFIGFVRPQVTGVPVISELQSRWISQEIIFRNTLPEHCKMVQEIDEDVIIHQAKFPKDSKRLVTIVNPYDYMEMVAEKIRSTPRIWEILLNNVRLWFAIVFAPWNHYMFRLHDLSEKKREIAHNMILQYGENPASNRTLFEATIFAITNIIVITTIILCILVYFYIKHIVLTR